METMAPSATLIPGSSRKLGEQPVEDDLRVVTFSQGNIFSTGEIVLVPRSKGGFVYGRIVKRTKFENCLYDTSKPHTSPQYRVEYPDKHSQQDLFKTLPPTMLGKIPETQTATHIKVTGYRRELGGPATLRDMNNVVYSLENIFSPGEMVLVSRSHGGLTYGEVNVAQPVNCSFASKDARHPVNGWRVFIDGNKKMRKDLSPELIGKLAIVVHTNSEASISRKNRTVHSVKKRVDNQFSKNSEELGETLPVTAHHESGPIKRMHSLSKSKHETADLTEYVGPTVSSVSQPSVHSRARATLTSGTHNSAGNLFAQYPTPQPIQDDDFLEEEILIWNQPDSPNISPPLGEISSDSQAPIEPCSIQEPASPSKKGIIEIPTNVSLRSPKKIPYNNNNGNHGRRTSCYNKNNNNPSNLTRANKPVVIIDAPNVAVKHGKGTFSTKGIIACVKYWQQQGHRVTAFLPENYIYPNGNEPPKANDIPTLQQLMNQEILFLTPPQDYDDSYCIAYAQKHNGIIVTNDLYRDHVDKQEQANKHKVRKWIKSHCVSFTFIVDDFFPNPDFVLP